MRRGRHYNAPCMAALAAPLRSAGGGLCVMVTPLRRLSHCMDTTPAFREELYPPIEPFRSGRLVLDDIHTMYWEQSGNPQGVPAITWTPVPAV